jgi:hypothetical protein
MRYTVREPRESGQAKIKNAPKNTEKRLKIKRFSGKAPPKKVQCF